MISYRELSAGLCGLQALGISGVSESFVRNQHTIRFTCNMLPRRVNVTVQAL